MFVRCFFLNDSFLIHHIVIEEFIKMERIILITKVLKSYNRCPLYQILKLKETPKVKK